MKKQQWILAICIFLTLMSLGTWQLYRLQWKEHLIECQNEACQQPPVCVNDICQNPQAYAWRQIVTEGEWESTTYFIIGRTHAGKPGYHAVQALKVNDTGEKVIVNRGWTPHKNVTPAKGKVKVHGIVRPVEEPAWWHPTHRLQEHELGYVDPVVIQANERFYITQTDTQLAAVDIPTLNNPHLGYAITWFLLAVIWLNMVGWYWWKYHRNSTTFSKRKTK